MNHRACSLLGVSPWISWYANFRSPVLLTCFAMNSVVGCSLPPKYASSSCTRLSSTVSSLGNCSRNVSYHRLIVGSDNSLKLTHCLTGICVVQHHNTNHHCCSGSLQFANQVCDVNENLLRHFLHQYLSWRAVTCLELHIGQCTCLPYMVCRKNLRICASVGICLSWYISGIVALSAPTRFDYPGRAHWPLPCKGVEWVLDSSQQMDTWK